MRSLEDANRCGLLMDKLKCLSDLRALVRVGNGTVPLAAGLRSTCWKAFLLFESTDRTKWPAILADSRAAYVSLRSHFLRAIEHPDEIESAIDPLSESDESPWVALRKDETLRAEIFQDVERCMPDNFYFRQPTTQTMLLDILFVFRKLNPDVGYRQGMHEVLAPILWVVERDAIEPESLVATSRTRPQGSTLLPEVFDACYVEHDTFTLFGLIMRNAKSFYEPGMHGKILKSTTKIGQQNDNPMVVRCKHIFEELLPQADPGLAAHLQEIDVVPQIFLMRWIRLIFGREFAFDNVLEMWDLILAEDSSLELVNEICVAMLLRIRWQLVDADYNTALTLLLHYPDPPASQGPQTLVLDALHLKHNLTPDSGSALITKYTKRSPPLLNRLENRSATPQLREETGYRSARSSFPSPANLVQQVQQSSSLEAILQDAARGVYTRGEKWGVNKAVRDAVDEVKKNVQGLQSSQGSPQPNMHGIKATFEAENRQHADPSNVLQKITALEERNKSLAKMLEGAVAELWNHQKDSVSDKSAEDDAVKALSVAIARVQFVQVYLEDSSIPLPVDETRVEHTRSKAEASTVEQGQQASLSFPTSELGAPHTSSTEASESSSRPLSIASTSAPQPNSPSKKPPPLPTTSASTSTSADPTGPYPFHRPRPSLAQSSFSWMLGQDNRQTSFVSARPFSSDKRNSKGFLFGEEETDPGAKKNEGKAKGRAKEKRKAAGATDDLWAEEGERETIGLDKLRIGKESS
ncbi:hypothetical protein B0A49_02725 [Cryomyces minteri]|uniref:Rab-GAP TBC domain-containing protein n=1 Tax=Cryomyces minteri TaxID=331657 RepID=A0A4U0XBG6_9PEZI|nr:hypothetical protein B0A49_02725 [Cryomyces minteri]